MSDTTPSKVRFGLKKLYFAKQNDDGTYEKPWPNPGAESADVSNSSGDRQIISADDGTFYAKSLAGSKSIDLTVARFVRDYYTKLLGQTLDTTTGGLIESPDDVAAKFACMFEVSGDQGAYRSCFFGCTSTVPTYSAATNTESSLSEAAEKATLTVDPVECADGLKHMCVTYEPGDAGYDDFFSAVPLVKTSSATTTTTSA